MIQLQSWLYKKAPWLLTIAFYFTAIEWLVIIAIIASILYG